MSEIVAWKSTVAGILSISGDRAMEISIVEGNHAIAWHYIKESVQFHFANRKGGIEL